MFHNTGFIQRPLAIFEVGTLVVLFLTFGDADLHFAPGVLPVQREVYFCVVFSVDAAVQGVQLALIKQQLTGTLRVTDVVVR